MNATAYGQRPHHCKVSDWGHRYADLQVGVRCFSAAGADAALVRIACHGAAGNLVDSRFTILGLVGAPGGHVFFDGVLVRRQFNSVGRFNTVTHSAVGAYGVRLAGLGPSGRPYRRRLRPRRRSLQGAALGRRERRARRRGCHDVSGLPVDSAFVVSYAV